MKPRNWKQGDPISAARLNDMNADAARSRRQFSLGSGSSMVNETMGNNSSLAHEAGARFVIAVEDFAIVNQPTDIYALNDPQYHGLCKMMRLNSGSAAPTGLYEEEVHSEEFRVWDPIALLTASASKSIGDIFHTVYNKDSKRWEVLAGGSSSTVQIRHAVVCQCVAEGWYAMELVDNLQDAPPDCDPACSDSASMSASNAVPAGCDICTSGAVNYYEQCGGPAEFDPGRIGAIGNGTYIYAYDKRTVPLRVGGQATVAWLGDLCNPTASDEASASNSTDLTYKLWTVLNGEYEMVLIPHEVWECCPIEGIKKVACYTFITEGVMCTGPSDPCATSESV